MINVSIIVPAYNAQKYISRCLNELLVQGFDENEYEIICIDDCSNDNTAAVLKKYEQRYKHIRCFYNDENKGVSYSRNLGLQMSQGEYIAFCDADDWYEKNSIGQMFQEAKKENADVLITSYYLNKGNRFLKRSVIGNYTKNPISKEELIKYMDISSCAKLIKRRLLIENELYYPTDLKRCEEYPVIPVSAYLAKRVLYQDCYTYHYFQNPKSASNRKEKELYFFEEAFERYKNYIDLERYKKEIKYRAIEHLLYGKTICMLKANVDSKDIKKEYFAFCDKYGTINRYEIKNMGISRKMILEALKLQQIWVLRILVKIHSLITG